MSAELFMSYHEHVDWLTLIEFGHVENAQPRDPWRGVNHSFVYILRHAGGPEIGFKILDDTVGLFIWQAEKGQQNVLQHEVEEK